MQAVGRPDGSFEPTCLLGSVVATCAVMVSCDHGTRRAEEETSAPRAKDGETMRGHACPRSTTSVAEREKRMDWWERWGRWRRVKEDKEGCKVQIKR